MPGYEAPVYVAWSQRNRSALIRIPLYKPGSEEATRAEIRCPDPACNPYLTFAALLHAGLEGIERGYELPEPMETNLYHLTPEQREERGIVALPRRSARRSTSFLIRSWRSRRWGATSSTATSSSSGRSGTSTAFSSRHGARALSPCALRPQRPRAANAARSRPSVHPARRREGRHLTIVDVFASVSRETRESTRARRSGRHAARAVDLVDRCSRDESPAAREEAGADGERVGNVAGGPYIAHSTTDDPAPASATR